MNPAPLVSVILPTYNRADLLPRAVSSVLAQTYPHWELIVWDDGSTDNTAEVVRSYGDERVRYFRNDNHGISYARNRAVENARGELLAFLDSDDAWCAEKLLLQVEALLANPQVDFLFTDFLNVNIVAQKQAIAFEQNASAMRLMKVERTDDDVYIIRAGMPESIAVEDFIAADSVVLKKEVLARFGGYDESLRSSVDFELGWRLGLAGVRFGYINKVLLVRYKPADSLSGHSKTAYDNRLHALDVCLGRAVSSGRRELTSFLKPGYRDTWQHLIAYYGRERNGKGVLNAFAQSLRYGLSLGSFHLLLQAVLNQVTHRKSGG